MTVETPHIPLAPTDWQTGASGRRSLMIFAAGAVLGLGIAGYSLFTARGTTIGGVPSEDVALVNQRPILVSDFNAQVETEFGTPAARASRRERQSVLDEMIHEELFVQRGLELDMPSSDPSTRAALVASVEQQATADAVAEQPDMSALRRFYDSHRSLFATEGTMTVSDYRVAPGIADPRTAAAAGAVALRTGNVAALRAIRLINSGRTNGADFYFAARIHLGPRLFEAARALRDGEVSPPIAAPDGWHVLAMRRNVPPRVQPFADALPQVMTRYRQDAAERLMADEGGYLRDSADIRIAQRYK